MMTRTWSPLRCMPWRRMASTWSTSRSRAIGRAHRATVKGGDALWFANKVAKGEDEPGPVATCHGLAKPSPLLVDHGPAAGERAVERDLSWHGGHGCGAGRVGCEDHQRLLGRTPRASMPRSISGPSSPRMWMASTASKVPSDSPFYQGLQDVRRWKNGNSDWKATWLKIKGKYSRYPSDCGSMPWNCGVSAMINGLMGGMAFLYGAGDFRRTVGLAGGPHRRDARRQGHPPGAHAPHRRQRLEGGLQQQVRERARAAAGNGDQHGDRGEGGAKRAPRSTREAKREWTARTST